VAFDLLALGDEDVRPLPFAERRSLLAGLFASATPPLHLTPATADPVVAADWFDRFEGAGFDGVIAKPTERAYEENKRSQWKVKHLRTADMVVAGYRMHKDNEGVGSLLLGLGDSDGRLHHVGVCSAFAAARRAELVGELAPFVAGGAVDHPWNSWGDAESHAESDQRMPGAPSRWSGQRSHDWVPLRCELVAEVAYQGLQNGNRLRHPARFVRWRPDKDASGCRYDQLEQVAPAELAEMFGRS
jgi:ATP-dependent DNA ligase